ncbi:hypothetical protein ACET3Z_009006 [Daucus carota]
MPGFFCDEVRGFEFVDMNDCLTLIVYEYNHFLSKLMLNLFSLDGEEGCSVWTKMYTIRPFNRGFEVLQGFYGGEIVFHKFGQFCCYDRKTDTIHKLLNTSSATTNDWCRSCFRYTPSLAFIEGMKSVFYSTTRTRRAGVQYSRVPHFPRLDAETDDVLFYEDLICTDLHNLWLQSNNHLQQICGGFFSMFPSLSFLVLQNVIISVEQFSLQSLSNLGMLTLLKCDMSKTDVSLFPKKLKTLRICKCELPRPLDLTDLKYL